MKFEHEYKYSSMKILKLSASANTCTRYCVLKYKYEHDYMNLNPSLVHHISLKFCPKKSLEA